MIDDVVRRADALLSVVVPDVTAERLWGDRVEGSQVPRPAPGR